jgi:hypothetical protein
VGGVLWDRLSGAEILKMLFLTRPRTG